jgi:hypothetical protein
MKKQSLCALLLMIGLTSVLCSCKKNSSSDPGGEQPSAFRVSSYKMFQDSNLYESWENIYSGSLLTEVRSKVYYNNQVIHCKNTIEYIAGQVSVINSYDSAASGWVKRNDVVVTSWTGNGLPDEIIYTYYDPGNGIHQQNITKFTYEGGQVKNKEEQIYYQDILTNNYRTEYTYDQNSRMIRKETFKPDSSLVDRYDYTWQNGLVVSEHFFYPDIPVNQTNNFTYSGGKLINSTCYNDQLPGTPCFFIDFLYNQNGCLVSSKSKTVTSASETLEYTYESGQGNFRQVQKITSLFENWTGNPRPYPSKAGVKIPSQVPNPGILN